MYHIPMADSFGIGWRNESYSGGAFKHIRVAAWIGILKKDHILAKFTIGICLMINSDRYLPGSDKNWNSRSITDMDNPDQLEHHCCLYRQLYDRTQISWEDMLRIGSAWVHINITLHHHLRFP